MSDSFVQLPTDGSGKEIRTLQGDNTNQVPTGVMEEVVVSSDAQGLLPGDARQRWIMVRDPVLEEILRELKELRQALEFALG